MLFFRRKKRKSGCHIWLKPTSQGTNPGVQEQFNQLMGACRIPPGLSEHQLTDLLTEISRKLDHEICYHMTSDQLEEDTRITYQISENPRVDDVIPRV